MGRKAATTWVIPYCVGHLTEKGVKRGEVVVNPTLKRGFESDKVGVIETESPSVQGEGAPPGRRYRSFPAFHGK